MSHVRLYGDDPAYIPCRVSNPAAVVTLHETSGTLIAGPTYDPRYGFHVTKNQSSLHGLITCEARLGDMSDKQDFLIFYESK